MPITEPLLTAEQAGALLGKSGRTVRRLAIAGKIAVARQPEAPSDAYLFRPADVLKFAEDRAEATEATA
jgi:Helix-turn-helix domain